MITAGEIYDAIDSFAPFDTAMSFDNVGLLIGSREQTSAQVLLALDVTADLIREAQEKGVKIIVTHHPVIFSPLKDIPADSIQYRLISAGITVISAHTNLDIAENGVNDTLAEQLGVISEKGTDEDCFLFGELEREITAEEFACRIADRLGCAGLRYTRKNGSLKKVGIACGAGGSSVFKANELRADAFVTGEIKHHEILFAREHNIAVFDIGHFRSEDMIIEKLAERLSKLFPSTVFNKAVYDTEELFYIGK